MKAATESDPMRTDNEISDSTTTGSIGERFARALSNRDHDGLKCLLAEQVDFRAMTPSRFWESSDPAVVVDETILGTWFSPARGSVELVALQVDSVGPVDRVGYRLELEGPDGHLQVEQQAYLRSEGGRVEWLRIMCTGFLPVAD